eukprot:scaffold517_cov119-Cylindrotheca_fusiformis.AAC.31
MHDRSHELHRDQFHTLLCSHRKLVLGSGGRILQRIQESATRDLKELFGCDVSLRLNVKLNKSKQRRNAEDFS